MRDYEPYYTEDGSIGLYSYADKDVYHSKFGAVTEAWEKFVLPSGIDKLIKKKNNINVLDVCYGIGYNSKVLMSHILDLKQKELKRKNLFQKLSNIVSIHTYNNSNKNEKLLSHNDTIYDNNKTGIDELKINIDCMDINEELVKLSPFFKRIKTPGEVYEDFVPEILNCFDTYYKIERVYENVASHFYPKNRKEIKELLELKFKNMHIDKEYKINNLVNYFILNKMYEMYGRDYIDEDLKKILTQRKNLRFLDKNLIKYANFNQKYGYSLSSELNLSTFLHNIYYSHLSKRYKNIDFKAAEKLFNMTFYINDARKSIRKINKLYDLIFLDAFSYTKAAQLWSVEFIAELFNRLSEHGILLTYSNSAQVRNTLLENKFYVGKIYNKKTDTFIGTVASKDKLRIKYPLSNYEIGLCNTKAGIPYHDPNLAFSNKEIMELREYEFMHSNLMSSSKYMKIRSLGSKP